MLKGPFFLKPIQIFFIFLAIQTFSFFLSVQVSAQDCPAQLQNLKSIVYKKYDLENRRHQLINLRAGMSQQENTTFLNLSQKFQSIPQDSEQNMNDLFALQKESRHLVRSIAQRAGYRIYNPEEQSPFDAVIAEVQSADGFTEYVLEVRSLLIRKDPLPHLTLWSYRQDPAHNPWKMVSIGILPQAQSDYASWKNESGGRVSGTMKDFLKAQLPQECQ